MNPQNKSNEKNSELQQNSITYAYIIVSTILVYNILIPIIIKSGIDHTGLDILKNQLINNKYKFLVINYFVHTMILRIAEKFPQHIPIFFRRLLIILVYNMLISIYVNKISFSNENIKYMRDWLKHAGWISVIWEIVYISLVGKLADKIDGINIIKKEPYKILLFILVTISLLHL